MATDHNFKVKKGLDVLGGDVNLGDGFAYKIDGTTVVDSSRNLANIGTVSSGSITSSNTVTAPTLIAGAYGAGGSAGDGFRINSTDIYGQIDSVDKVHISAVTGHIGVQSGHSIGKFAIMSSGVHNNYDFYNNGTSYLNGNTIVDAILDITGSTASLRIGGTEVISTGRNLSNIGTISSGAITSTGNLTAAKVIANSGGLRVHGGGTYSDDGNQMYLHTDSSGFGRLAVHDLRIMTGANNSRTEALRINSSGNSTFAGTITANGTSNSSLYALQLSRSGSGTATPDIWGTNGTLVIGTSSTDEVLGMSGTAATFYGNLSVSGNLTISGTTTTLNTATLQVEDKNIVLNYGTGDTSSSANGAGITIQDAMAENHDATILWDTSNDRFNFSDPINVGLTGANQQPGTDSLNVAGYGIIGNRGAVYLTNANSNGTVQIGVGGAHNANPKLTVASSAATFTVPVTSTALTISSSDAQLKFNAEAYKIKGGGYYGDIRIVAPRFRVYEDNESSTAKFQIDGGNATFAGSVTGTYFLASGADSTPAGTTFPNAFKGGTRVVYFDGDATVSTWYGSGNTPYAAIDATNGVLRLYVNNTSGSWNERIQMNSSGITHYGTTTVVATNVHLDSTSSAYYRADGGTNQWKYLSLQTNGSTNWDIATKNDDLSGALQFRPGGGPTNRTSMSTAGDWTFGGRITVGDTAEGQKVVLNFDTGGSMILGNDGSYGTTGNGRYTTLGFGGRTNGVNRIFAHNGTADGMYFAAATGQGFRWRPNGSDINEMELSSSGLLTLGGGEVRIGQDGSYGNYATVGFGGTSNGSNRIFAHKSGGDGLFLTSATSRHIYFRTNGSADETFRMSATGDFQMGSANTTVIDASRNLTNIGTITNSGKISSSIGSNATYSRPLLEITSSATPTQIKITTNIPYSGSGASTHAHSVRISGFQYGSAQMADLQIGWHVYLNQFYNRSVTSSGSWAPTVTLAVENNKVVIHLASPGYWPKLYVESMYNAYGGAGQASGWSWSDAAISADANTPNQTVPYKLDFGDGLLRSAGTTVIDSNSFRGREYIRHNNSSNIVMTMDNDTYTMLRNPLGETRLWLGSSGYSGASSDTNNYYNASTHFFRDTGSSESARISGLGVDAKSGGFSINGTSVINSSRNIHNVGSLALSSSITVNNNQKIYFKNSSGTSNSFLYRAGGNATRFEYADNAFIFDAASDTDFSVRNSNDANVFNIDVSDIAANTSVYTPGNYNAGGNIQTASTTRITSSGNLINIGSISSGAITANGGGNQSVIKSSSDAPLIVESTDAYSGINFKDTGGNSSMYYHGSSDQLYLHSAKFSVAGSTLASGYQFQVNGSANLTGSLAIGGTQVIAASTRNLTNIGTISSGAITASGAHTFTSNDVDFIVQDTTDSVTNYIWRDHSGSKLYLGTQDAVVHLRSALQINGSTRIDMSGNATLGTISSGAITSGAITSSGDVKLNGSAKKYAAPVYRDVVTGISNSGYTTLFTVDGGGLASTIRMTLAGTTGSVVVNVTADITVGHYQDILITSQSGFYTTVTLRVISNNNEDFAVQATTNHANSVNLTCEVFPLNNELVTFTTSHSFTGSTHTHTCYYGTHTSGTGGNDGDFTVNGRTFLQDGTSSSPALTFRNDHNTGLYRVGSDSLGWVVGGSRKFYTSASRAYFQNLSEGVDVPSLRISGTTVIDSSRNIFGVQGSFTDKVIIGTEIGSRTKSLSIDNNDDSSPLAVKTNHNTVFSVLPWSGGETYIASGIYYDDGSWVHASPDTTNCLFKLDGSGVTWYSSNNSSGSWNVASDEALWDSTGTWVGEVDTSSTIDSSLGFRVNGTTVIDNGRKLTNITGGYFTGNVGIRANNPDSALAVRGTGSGASQKNTISFGTSGWGNPAATNAALDGGVKLALFEGSTQKVQIGMDGNARLWLSSTGSGTEGIDFYTGSSDTAAPSVRMRIDKNGTVGINKTSMDSSYKLDIAGHIKMNNNHIHYANEVHFNNGTRFKTSNTSTTLHRSNHATASYIALDTNGTIRGYVAGNSDSGHSVGFLDQGGSWAVRHINDQGTIFTADGGTEQARIGSDLVSGDYGGMVLKSAKNGYVGYSLNDRAVFMHNNSTVTGIYNDVGNEWYARFIQDGAAELYHNGHRTLFTHAPGAIVDSASGQSTTQIQFSTNGDIRGYVYGNTGNNIGFLDAGGNWAIRHIQNSGTEFRQGNAVIAGIGADRVGGSFGSMVVNDTKGGWGGYSINNRVVFMHDNGNTAGLYNDVNNQWLIKTQNGGETELYHNGTAKLQTTGSGVTVTGNVTHDGLTMTSGTDIDQLYTVTDSLTITTSWQDTSINSSELATGTYIMQVYAHDPGDGGSHYNEYYSGVISWYGSATNSSEVDEIVMHRAGHAPNASVLHLRTQRHPSGGDNLVLQIKANYTRTAASNYTFKFRRMI